MMSHNIQDNKRKPYFARKDNFRPMTYKASSLLLVGLLLSLSFIELGEARRRKVMSSGYSKMTFQREVKITDKDKNKLVNETINIIIETDDEVPVHYELPMDYIQDGNLYSPSGLNATSSGSPKLVGGVRKNAIMVQGVGHSGVLISRGGTMVHECFFDLTYCREGYSISLWANFPGLPNQEHVYMSSGGDLHDNHGLAMSLNQYGQLTFTFKTKDGRLQKFTSDLNLVSPNRWYNILATWSKHRGVQLYINGLRVRGHPSESSSSPMGLKEPRHFWFGRSLRLPLYSWEQPFIFDDVNFWMLELDGKMAREIGYIDIYRLPISDIRRNQGDPLAPKFLTTGKSEDALEFDGERTFFSDDSGRHCHNNVSSCFNGFLLSGWMKFGPFKNGGHYVSTGDYGLKLYYKDKALVGEALFEDDFWNVSWKRVADGQWHFVELSMSPDENLVLYVDQYPVSTARNYRGRLSPNDFADSTIEFGRKSYNLGHAAFILDVFELWSADRNMLEVLGYIIRGRPTRYHIPMDYIIDSRIPHQNLSISVVNRPVVVKGKVRDAIDLAGKGQYLRIDTRQGHVQPCFSNLNFCKAGATVSMWIKPGGLTDGMEFFSTGTYGLKMWLENGRTMASARTSDREWTLVGRNLIHDKWQFVELTYDPQSGSSKLKLYIDGKLEGESDVEGRQRERETTEPSGDVYIGRGDGTRPNSLYGTFTVDEFEYWFANRDYLTRFNFIKRGQLSDHIHLTMDDMRDNKLPHHFLDVAVHGSPNMVGGKIGNALNFNGARQYLDLGSHRDNCFGDLALCQDGLTGSMWVRFNSFPDHGYLFSNGGGLQVYTADGQKLFVVVDIGGKKWQVSVPGLVNGKWYFVEYTWHPNAGLKVYINNHQVGMAAVYQPSIRGFTSRSGRVLIGAANPGEPDNGRVAHNVDAVIDEFEYWFLDRDSLIGSKSIVRDPVTYIHFPFEVVDGNRVYHPDFSIYLHNGATLTRGRVGNGLLLLPRSYASFQDQSRICMGNIALCFSGLTISMLIRPSGEVGKILTSGSYSVSLVGDELQVKFQNGTNVWSTNTRNALKNDVWQQLDLSWHPEKGLEVWVDDRRVANEDMPEVLRYPEPQSPELYLGWPSEISGRQTGNVSIDELQFWYSSRDALDLDPIINRIFLDMDVISGNRLINPYQIVRVFGNAMTVPAVNASGVDLEGQGQFLESADSQFICRGNLEDCQQGFTLRFKLKPNQILDNQYLLSSAPIDVYLKNRRLITDLRTSYRMWKVTSGELSPDTWYQVDLSWSPAEGAALYINGEKVSSTMGEANPGGQHTFSPNRKFYIGRANTNMFNEKYGSAVFDDMQFWEARRDLLIRKGLIYSERTTGPTLPWGVYTPPPSFVFPSIYPGSNKRLIFDGRTWYIYDLSNLPSEFLRPNREEKLRIHFQTTHPNGLLWYNGDPNNNVHLVLKDGQLFFVITKDGKVTRTPIGQPPMNDNQWHEIFVTRNGKEVEVLVDGQGNPFMVDFPITFFRPQKTYIGGSNHTWDLTHHFINSNFDGKIREIWHSGDSFPKDFDYKGLIFLKPQPPFMHMNGTWIEENDDYVGLQHPKPFIFHITEGSDKVKPKEDVPVTFDGTSFLSVAGVRPQEPAEGGVWSYEMKYRTTQPNSILAFIQHHSYPHNNALIELYDGVPYLVADFGRGYQRLRFGNRPVRTDDNREHYVKVMSSEDWLKLTLDDETVTHQMIPGRNRSLDFFSSRDKTIYIGGGPEQNLPWHSWNRLDRKPFRGCAWGVRFNSGEPLDLAKAIRGSHGIQVHCMPPMEFCSHRPCRNGGVCSEVQNGYHCDCSGTQFTGKNCEISSEFASFGDRDRFELTYTPTKVTHTNDISLRFRTPKENVHLFSATNYRNDDLLRVTLEGGVGRVESRFGNSKNSMFESFKCAHPLNDNQWHTVHIKRRANHLEAYVDDCEKIISTYPWENFDFLIDRIILGRDDDLSFIGHLQNFVVDGVDVFPNIGLWNILTTVNTTRTEKVMPFNSITIRANSNAFLYLDPLQFFGNTNVSFMFRTRESNVILLYNSGHEEDFFAVELVDGHLHVVANDGTGVRDLTSSAGRINDDNWHEVTIEQKSNNQYDVVVDQRYRNSITFLPSRHTLDLKDKLYMGNVPQEVKERLPVAVQSRTGYSGCLASLVINRKFYQLDSDLYLSPFITMGCSNATGYCVQGICQNGGECHETVNGFWCDCNMTSYGGSRCHEEAKGFRFSMRENKGIAIMRLEPWATTSSDRVALMFMTHEPNGTLLKADGRQGDFIELKLVNGHVVAVYRVGDKIHEIVERRRVFNDGHPHRVIFFREGGSAHLSVDDYPENKLDIVSSGTVLFNDMSLVKLGGDLDQRNEIINHFDGIISGVHINGWRVVENGGTVIRGDVEDAVRPFYIEKRYPTYSSPKPSVEPTLPPDIKPPQPDRELPGGNGEGISWGDEGIINPEGEPIFEQVIGEAMVPAGDVQGARAAGVAGAMIGALLLASSAMWALYKFKPGLLGASKTPAQSAAVPLLGSAVNGDTGVPKNTEANLKDHFPSMSAPLTGAAPGVDSVDGGVVITGGTIQGYHISGGASNAPAGYQTVRSTASEYRHDTSVQGFQEPPAPQALNQSITYSYERSQTLTQQGGMMRDNYSLPSSPGQFGTNLFGTGQFSMRNVDLSYGGFNHQEIFTQQQQQRMMQQQQQLTLGQGQRTFMTAEEIRVDCVQMTNNGRYVVTGSNCGPPQVWDLKSGELVKVMRGEELSSTDLHLANGDTLLVGQVAEMEPIDLNETNASNRVHQRRLQIWDFETGKPLEMSRSETCTASCMMSDGEKVVLGRTDKFGGGTTIVIWDILNNEPVRQIKCDASIGFADHISYLNASKDGRYIIAGFQNSYDGTANYITFDLASPDPGAGGVKVAAMDAVVEVTALLNDKEAITGTRSGEIVVWSLKTGRQVRSIGGPGLLAHQGEIKEVVVSRDGQLLVSASADGTLKVWEVESENLVHTLIGHRDEVWCATVSPDNELVGSGSRDGTIRLWKVSDGTSVAAIDAGMTIFKVLLSNNKKTIVALGDKGGARKLIMLRVVRSTATIDRRTFNA